jgi:hypothetical protein
MVRYRFNFFGFARKYRPLAEACGPSRGVTYQIRTAKETPKPGPDGAFGERDGAVMAYFSARSTGRAR